MTYKSVYSWELTRNKNIELLIVLTAHVVSLVNEIVELTTAEQSLWHAHLYANTVFAIQNDFEAW